MKKAIAWVKESLASRNIVAFMTHYYVNKGTIYATDGRAVAAHPFPFDGEFLAPGKELEAILARFPDDKEISLETHGATIQLKVGRFRGTLHCLDPRDWTVPYPDAGAWQLFPQDILSGLGTLRPLISDNATRPYAMCVYIDNGAMYATNNVILATMPCKAMGQLMIPAWAIDFLLKRPDGITHWQYSPNALAIQWENGAWFRTQLLADEYPKLAIKLLGDAPKAKFKLTPEWLEAVERVAFLANGMSLRFYKDLVATGAPPMMVEEAIKTPLPKGVECTTWDPDQLLKVLSIAEYWQPDLWPEASSFRGTNIHGVFIGRM